MMKSFSCFKPRDPFRNWSKELDKRVAIWAKNFDSSYKLLLLGPAGAGKTTILKQMKIIHNEGFSLEERQQKAKEIRSNLLESVRELTSCITASGHQINWCDKENQNRLDFINGINLDNQTYDLYSAKIYDYSKKILTDKGVEELFSQLNQLSITHRSQYLLNRVDEIRDVNYIPNNDDILQSRRRTSDIQKLEFQVKLAVKSGSNIEQTFCIFDVGGQRGERRKWIQVFDGVSAVMFLIDSSSFDAIDDENGRNKLKETIELFYEVWMTRFLLNSNFVLLFNKQDILKEKIQRGHRIEDHFPEYKHYKCQTEDKALLSRAYDKLNLFRSSSRSGTSASNRASCSAASGGGGSRSTPGTPTPSGALTSSTTGSLLRNDNKRKYSSSLYRFSTGSLMSMSMNGRTSSSSSSAAGGGGARAHHQSSRHNTTTNTNLHNKSLINSQNLPSPLTAKNTAASSTTHQPQFSSSSSTPTSTSASQPLTDQAASINKEAGDTSSTTNNSPSYQQQQQTSANINNNNNPAPTNSANQPTLSSTTTQTQKSQQELKNQNPEQAYLRARSFIRDKFLQITRQVDYNERKYSTPSLMYNSSGGRVDQPKRTVCYHYTTATDTENIRDLFENLQKMVIKSTMKDFR